VGGYWHCVDVWVITDTVVVWVVTDTV
jgi:hypothetical protein